MVSETLAHCPGGKVRLGREKNNYSVIDALEDNPEFLGMQ